MKIYLASRFSNRHALRRIRDELIKHGHFVVSHWIDVEIRPGGKAEEDYWKPWAIKDIEDLTDGDLLILYTEYCTTYPPRGAMRFEEGYVYAQQKPIIVVGPRIIVFDQLTDIHYCNCWEECFELLQKLYN
jgi:nucleoside 2-deoxyribosyltransferase